MSFSKLQTVMFEAAQIVNQGPIGIHPTCPEECLYLCPNDLVLGRSTSHVSQGPFLERVSNKHRLDFIQAVVERFWQRWSRDVFPFLVIRHKWHVERRNVAKGDVVLIQDNNLLQGEWKKGVVMEVFPSQDGKVRRVLVSYKNFSAGKKSQQYKGVKFTTVERPVQRLVVLVAKDDPSM